VATGNSVVWKPSEKTPLSSRLVVERVFGHLPPGVVNIVLGDGTHAGEALVRNRGVDAVAFIGSVRVGRRIGEICGHDLKKAILELGGKDPLIIDETVDVGKAAKLAASAAYANAGQICTSIERIYVQQSIYTDFCEALVSESKAIRIGEGHEPEVQMGPLVDAMQLEKVSGQVIDACRLGARVLCGGARLNRLGYFYPPTVMTDVPDESLLIRDETFGPIAPVFKFGNFEQAIELANESEFGLAAMVFTESSAHAIAALQGLKVGTVKINTMRGRAPGSAAEPVKSSGIGHGSGMDILQELTRQKAVHWRGSID
jgi:acyl-CoA reductase-like NAD-dependent aldehyde dehydrogenase